MPRWGLIVYNKRISTTLSDFTHHNPASLSWRTFLCRSAVQLVAAIHFLRSLVVAHGFQYSAPRTPLGAKCARSEHPFASIERHRGVTVVPWIFVNLHTLSAVDLQLQKGAPACGSRWMWTRF